MTPTARNTLQIGLTAFIATLFVIVLAVGILFFLDNDDPDSPQAVETVVTSAASEGINIIDPPQAIADFALRSSGNDAVSLSDFRGKYVLMAFGYTHCPDVCPATLLDFRRVKRDLGEQAENVEFVFISFDADRDTPEVLNRYVTGFDDEFIGLSGMLDDYETIGPEFNLFYSIRENTGSSAGALVDHSASRYLINPQGQLVRIYSFTADVDAIVTDLQQLF